MTKKIKKRTALDNYKRTCRRYFVIKDDDFIDVIFAAIFANRLDAKPVWVFMVGPSSGGRSAIIASLNGEEIYKIASLTSNSFRSGFKTANKKDPSLLPKINKKNLVFQDFSCMLQKRRETLAEIIGQMRDAYDGSSRGVYGTGKDDEYNSKFGFLAGVTDNIDLYLGIMGMLGTRFLMYRMTDISETEINERLDVVAQRKSASERDTALARSAYRILRQKRRKEPQIQQDGIVELKKIVKFVAKARTHVSRDRYNRALRVLPSSEIPTRLMDVLLSLSIGIAIARVHRRVKEQDIRTAQKCAIGCIPRSRWAVLKVLVKSDKKISTAEVAKKLKIKRQEPVKLWLFDLELLDIIESKKDIPDVRTSPLLWWIKPQHKKLLKNLIE